MTHTWRWAHLAVGVTRGARRTARTCTNRKRVTAEKVVSY